MIYKITDRHYINPDEHDLFVQTNMDAITLIEILGCLQLKFEELVSEADCMLPKHIMSILGRFYDIKNVTEQYKKYTPHTKASWDDEGCSLNWSKYKFFSVGHPDSQFTIVLIDLFTARESCLRDQKQLMKRHLPKSKEFISMIVNHKECEKYLCQ
ncbi:hypothetical protein P8832_09700 [Bacillus subtilis]|uniref:hypothetical protein n=1 Tax=Bacillus subtilis TaxID=1423 RepID=UPI002DBBB2E9|nr:hypothetical protein [Bacillus subtilis]MEC0434434.1 hypothetical protein [Bacillus subtilis]